MEANGQEESPKWFEEYLNEQDDWFESMKGYLMVTATVIAGLSFQIMVNPPGGVWQGDACSVENQTCRGIPGTAVLEHVSSYRGAYLLMVRNSIVSFFASMTVILFVITGLRLRNRVIVMILSTLMIVAMMCTMFAFSGAVMLVQFEDKEIRGILVPFLYLFISFNGIAFTIQVFRLIIGLITV